MRKYVHIFVLLKNILLPVGIELNLKNIYFLPSMYHLPQVLTDSLLGFGILVNRNPHISNCHRPFNSQYFKLCSEFRAEEIFYRNIKLCG